MLSPLRKKRFLSELSLYDLCQRTGIDPARISLIERNYKIPRADEIKALAEALNCEPGEIFPANEGRTK